MEREATSLIDEAIGISAALEGAVSYESVFDSTFFERSRMIRFIERKVEAQQKAVKSR